MTSTQGSGRNEIDLTEAARQLQLAVHDAQVAYDCIGLGDLDAAHINTLTARAAADAAENILRTTLGESGPAVREVAAVESADPAHGAPADPADAARPLSRQRAVLDDTLHDQG